MSHFNQYCLFDFDGVIVDSMEAALEVSQSFNVSVTVEDQQRLMEGNIYDQDDRNPDGGASAEADAEWFSRYNPKLMKLPVYPGMRKVIHELSAEYTLIVISSSITAPIREWLEQYDLDGYFTEIMGADVHKSKVEKIRLVFDRYETEAEHCVFITDSLGDLHEAAKMKVPALAVDWGIHDRNRLAVGNPFAIVSTPKDIQPAIAAHFDSLTT